MAVGKARPDQPENNVINDYVTPAFGRGEDIARREVLEPKARSAAEIEAEDEVLPTGEEVHQKAREKSPETVEGQAALAAEKGKAEKVTGQDIVREVVEEKKERLTKEDDQAKAVREREAKVAEAKQAEEKERQKAADQAKKEAEQKAQKARDEAAKKATEPAQPKAGEAQKDREQAQKDAQHSPEQQKVQQDAGKK